MKKKFWIGILTAVLLLNLLPGMTPSAAADDTSSTVIKTWCYGCKAFKNFQVIGFIPTPISSTPDPVLHWATIKLAGMDSSARAVLLIMVVYLNILAEPKRPPAPQAKPARNAAANTAFSATSGAIGSPTATTPTPAPASAMAAARLKRETATAALRTAAHTALAPFAAERTSMPIILFLRAGTGALTRT